MKSKAPWLAVIGLLLLASSIYAQDLAGDWQGTLQGGNRPVRIIIKVRPADDGGWIGGLYSIDQGFDRGLRQPVSIARQGDQVKVVVDSGAGAFEGRIAGDTIEGTWTQRQSLPLVLRRATPETAWKDPAAHSSQLVAVEKNVKVEVLDFGGSGRSLVFLAGMGNTAHVFDAFAPTFTTTHHVYGITRRGFGESSVPKDGYGADRLGDDVLAVIDALNLTRPVLAGHSAAGTELSSIASRSPTRVAGLVYLDAGYPYAFYNAERGDVVLDSIDLRRKLDLLVNGPIDSRSTIRELLAELPRFERNLLERQKELAAMPPLPAEPPGAHGTNVPRAIMAGAQKFTNLGSVPILAIYALPHALPGPPDDPSRATRQAADLETTGAQAAAFEKGVPSARVVRLPNANHFVWRSHEADVLREMNAFLATLK
jgi:pimeloyl-ACP methyl ester carboxylesterase